MRACNPGPPREPLVVVWRITERCNLSCPFCAFDRSLDRLRREATADAAARFIDALSRHHQVTQRAVLLSWMGGEPLLWPHLRVMTRRAIEGGLSVSLTTNGTRLDEADWQPWALTSLAEITFSLDGPEGVNDGFRGEGHYRRTLERVTTLRRRRARVAPRLKVNTILMRENVEGFPGLCGDLAAAGVEVLTFNELGGRDRPEFHSAHTPTLDQLRAFVDGFDSLHLRMARRGLTISGGPNYLRRLVSSAEGRAMPVDECGPGSSFWFVDVDGAVSPCSLTGDAFSLRPEELATEEDLARVAPRLRELRQARAHPACRDCKSTQVFAKFSAAERTGGA